MSQAWSCPLCTRTDHEAYLQIGEHELRRCTDCGLIVTIPRLPPDKISRLYEEGYYSEGQAKRFRSGLAEILMQLFRYRRAVKAHRLLASPQGCRVLDVGCGRGYMLNVLRGWGYEVYGTQLSLAAVQFARDRLGLTNIFHGDLLDAGYPDGYFDFISMYHVLEHLPDPGDQLREVHRVLKPDGILYLEVPNSGSVSARWLKAHWLGWDLPRHRFHYNPATLSAMGERCGFVPVRGEYFSMEYSPATLLLSLVSAIFGDNNTLFQALTQGTTAPGKHGMLRSAQVAVHATVALLLSLPVVIMSLFLGLLKQGDTLAMYFRKQPTPVSGDQNNHDPLVSATQSGVSVGATAGSTVSSGRRPL